MIDDDPSRSKADRALWCAVISQALFDATRLVTPLMKARERHDQKIARNWFRFDSTDFREVCALAGLEADVVRAFALKQIALAEQKANTAGTPGVGDNLPSVPGDRRGRFAQHPPKIEFSVNRAYPRHVTSHP